MKRLLAALTVAVAAVVPGAAQTPAPAAGATDSLSVALGTVLGTSIAEIVDAFEGGGIAVDRGVVAESAVRVATGRPGAMDVDRARALVNDMLAQLKPIAGVDSFDTASQTAFLNEAAAREGAVRTPSGVVLEVITEGEGAMPGENDSVSLFYVGRLSDGTIFDATDDPVVFPLPDLVPGLREGLMLMRPGGKYRLTIPPELAYGEGGIPGAIPGRAALQFVVELLGVQKEK